MRQAVWWIGVVAVALVGCADSDDEPTPQAPEAGEAAEEAVASAPTQDRLQTILAEQPEDMRARYAWRHPEETLRLFQLEPGQTVLEALPGGGWYSKILVPYLGTDGLLIGADYEASMWPLFGIFDEESIAERSRFPAEWPGTVAEWGIEDGAEVQAYTLGDLPADLGGTVDRVLFIRALHNLARFETEGNYLTQALAETYRVLKPGGLVGVVQHRAPEGAPDDWATGAAGYLKEAAVKEAFLVAGFELAAESGVNDNAADQPTAEDVVWRLPPTLGTSRENPELRAQLEAVGESDRMTLVFRKPTA